MSHQKYAQTLQGKLMKNKGGTENTNCIAKQCYSSIVELQIHQINHSETKTERFSSYLTVNKIYFHYRTKSFNSAPWNNHSLLWETYSICSNTLWHNVEFLSLKPRHTMKLLCFFLDLNLNGEYNFWLVCWIQKTQLQLCRYVTLSTLIFIRPVVTTC